MHPSTKLGQNWQQIYRQQAALQTGGGNPAPQEELDPLEEQASAVISEESVVGVARQDSTDCGQLHHQHGTCKYAPLFVYYFNHVKMQKTSPIVFPHLIASDKPSPPRQHPVPDISDDGDDDNLPTIDHDPLQELLDSIRTPSPDTGRVSSVMASPHPSPTNQQALPATPLRTLDSEDPQITFQWTAVEVQRELEDPVRAGMETLVATLEGVRGYLSPNSDNTAPIKGAYSPLRGCKQSQADIAGVMRQRHTMERKPDSHMAAMTAYHCDVAAELKTQQILLVVVLPHVLAWMNAAAGSGSTSSAPDVCVPPSGHGCMSSVLLFVGS
ncbi:uncharacterized protein LOC144783997 [Lissotriton helveticus]